MSAGVDEENSQYDYPDYPDYPDDSNYSDHNNSFPPCDNASSFGIVFLPTVYCLVFLLSFVGMCVILCESEGPGEEKMTPLLCSPNRERLGGVRTCEAQEANQSDRHLPFQPGTRRPLLCRDAASADPLHRDWRVGLWRLYLPGLQSLPCHRLLRQRLLHRGHDPRPLCGHFALSHWGLVSHAEGWRYHHSVSVDAQPVRLPASSHFLQSNKWILWTGLSLCAWEQILENLRALCKQYTWFGGSLDSDDCLLFQNNPQNGDNEECKEVPCCPAHCRHYGHFLPLLDSISHLPCVRVPKGKGRISEQWLWNGFKSEASKCFDRFPGLHTLLLESFLIRLCWTKICKTSLATFEKLGPIQAFSFFCTFVGELIKEEFGSVQVIWSCVYLHQVKAPWTNAKIV